MGIVLSLLLFAAGAVMRYAVTVQGNGFDMHTTGVILMLVGAAGGVLSVVNWASWGGFGRSPGTVVGTQDTVVRETKVL